MNNNPWMHPGHLTTYSAHKSATLVFGEVDEMVLQREQFFRNLDKALWPASDEKEPSQGTFAACQVIKYSEGFLLKSFHVEGAGELQLPLSVEDASKLRGVCEQAPFGKGLNTVFNRHVRNCLQVDASKVTFPGAPTFLSNTIQSLATKAVRSLSLDGTGVQIEAHLYKLLFYETGGHFTFHRDTEKEKGMFGTLILQLPTDEGYTGGKLEVKHYSKVKKFDCHMVSTVGFCYTVFFADCLHELREIESGTRVCLAFNLVKRDSSLDPLHKEFIFSKVGEAEAALAPWLKEVTGRKLNTFSGKFSIPLRHKYTEANLCFLGLKGDDSIVAEVLMNCRDENKEKWLDLHLCLVTKHEIGDAERNRHDSYHDLEGTHHDMNEVHEEKIKFRNWIGLDDKPLPVAFQNLGIDFDLETVVGDGKGPFDNMPDEEEYEGYMGNYGPKLEHWYHTAMLVVWPKALSISIACQAGVSGALDTLGEVSDPDFCGQLHQIVSYCEKYPLKVWEAEGDSGGDSCEDSVTSRLLSLCTRAYVLEDVLRIFKLLARVLHYKPRYRYGYPMRDGNFKVGVRNAEVAEAIAIAIQAFGWESVSSHIIELVKECALAQGESLVQLAKELICVGNLDAGTIVANTIFEAFEAHIGELESHKMPAFSWYQPLAKLPEYPAIESFLKGPEEKYVHSIHGLPAARSFGDKYFNKYGDCTATDGYSATGTPGGQGRTAFCEIKKTRRIFDAAMGHWRKEQEEIQRLRLGLEKLRSAIPQADAVTVTTFPNWSGQGGSKRQRDTEVTEDTSKRAKSSTVDFLDLSL